MVSVTEAVVGRCSVKRWSDGVGKPLSVRPAADDDLTKMIVHRKKQKKQKIQIKRCTLCTLLLKTNQTQLGIPQL